MTDRIILIAPPGHRLGGKRTVRPQDLGNEQFIFREQGSATRAVVAADLRKHRIEAEAVMEMTNPESIKKAVQNGLGIAFISAFAVEAELKAKTLVTVNIPELDIRRELKIVHRKDKHLSGAAHVFVEIARNDTLS